MRLAVVGHVEWVEFLRVPHVPTAGEIVHTLESWAEPAGGGSVAAVQLAKLGGGADFFTALGDDEIGHRAHEEPGRPFAAAPLPGPAVDTYGAGDSFAAGLTYGLAAGMDVPDAVALAARCGAAAITGRGAFEGQLRL